MKQIVPLLVKLPPGMDGNVTNFGQEYDTLGHHKTEILYTRMLVSHLLLLEIEVRAGVAEWLTHRSDELGDSNSNPLSWKYEVKNYTW